MFARTTLLVACFVIVAAVAQQPDYGSYVVVCNPRSKNVTFVNFPQYGCIGEASLYVMPLADCKSEFLIGSWNAVCNETNMWYQNFLDPVCAGGSVCTRMYETFSCQNCTNQNCKNGPCPNLNGGIPEHARLVL
jgi:hypothetical protein